ncbi:MAG: DUF4296 domain-containing protein [Bacteroidota bacterium]
MILRLDFWGTMLLGLVIFVSCQNSEVEFDPLPYDVMQEILSEMHLADVVVDKRGGPLVMRRGLREDLYDQILTKYELDRQTFLLHYKYYMEHPSLMNEIYQSITEDLEKREEEAKKAYAQQQLREKAEREAAEKDSIQSLENADTILPSEVPPDVE